MIYTLTEYADKIARCHRNTLLSMIRKEQLPSNHIVKKGKQFMIEIVRNADHCQRCELYYKASVEYNQRKGYKVKDAELAAELCVKYDLGAIKFFAMHGIK